MKKSFSILFVVLLAACLTTSRHEGPPPNVLLMTADSLRADRVDYAPNGRTPALAALAARGVRFDRAYTVTPWTAPSLVSIFTGLYPLTHGVVNRDDTTPKKLPTLPRLLGARGWTLANYGFFTAVSYYRNLGLPEQAISGAEVVGSQALSEWLAVAPEPFFAWIHYTEPHMPYGAGGYEAAEAKVKGSSGLERAQLSATLPVGAGYSFEPGDPEKLLALYDEDVARMDADLGKVLSAIARRGISGRTIVVFTADHGEELLEHGWVGHASTSGEAKLTDEVLRIPLVLAGPGVPEGRRTNALAQNVDVTPTLLDLARVPRPRRMQGVSLVPAFDGKTPRKRAFFDTTPGGHLTPEARRLERLQGVSDGERIHVERLGGEPRDLDSSVPELARDLSRWRKTQARARVEVLSEFGGAVRPDTRDVESWSEALDVKAPPPDARLLFREAGAAIRLAWEGPRREEPPYWVEYKIGSGLLSASGAFGVEEPWISFGPFPVAFWDDLAGYSPFRFRILDPATKRRSAWRSFTVAGAALATPGDAVDDLLARSGMLRGDLGAAALAVPSSKADFALPHVDPLRREPLKLPAFASSYLETARRNGGDAARLFFDVGVAPRFPGLGSDPNLPAKSNVTLPLKTLPAPLRSPIRRLVAVLVEADAEVRRAWRQVPPQVAALAARRANLTDDVPDGEVALPDVEEAACGIDGAAMARAGLNVVAGVERAARELSEAVKKVDPETLATLRWDVETKFGRVRVAGTGSDRHVVALGEKPFLLLVDLGGDDVYAGSHAVGLWPEQPVSVVLDLGGNDLYEAGPKEPSQGSGLGGVGVLWDAAGDDRYRAVERSQGFAQFGVGVLVDESGRDDYRLGSAGQGAALFGAGLLLDRAGDDRYEILRDGQGYGGPGGCGTLVDLAGNDRYEAVRDPARAGRADPRADGKAATSNAQGAGVGRRGDGSGKGSWAGGIGALVDVAGNDEYVGGTFCQGAGYWFGTGLLVDGGGDDAYEAVWYAQGAAAHFALGTLLDVAGNDRYALVGTGGAGLGFGWDFAAGVFVDLSGDDTYSVRRLALGAAMKRSTGIFLDAAGDDAYVCAVPEECLGYVDDDAAWATRDPAQPRWHEGAQAGLFLDLGGSDRFPQGRGANGASWGTWEEGQRTAAPRNLGAGFSGTAALPAEMEKAAAYGGQRIIKPW